MVKYNRFCRKMGLALYNGDTEPPCPDCNTKIIYYGGDERSDSETYWECPNCGFKVVWDDVEPYIN